MAVSNWIEFIQQGPISLSSLQSLDTGRGLIQGLSSPHGVRGTWFADNYRNRETHQDVRASRRIGRNESENQ